MGGPCPGTHAAQRPRPVAGRGRDPPGRRRCATRSISRGSPIGSATTATGSPSTTAARCSPGPSPEVLIGPIAAATERIRVGSGGVMLPHYSPLKVAESFSVLAGLFPDRIDLAIGRAAGTDRMTTFALQRDRRTPRPTTSRSSSPSCSATSRTDRRPTTRSPGSRRAARAARTRPEPWLLGSSPQSALWAAELGLPYAFADFINPAAAPTIAQPTASASRSARLDAPRARGRGLGAVRRQRRGGRAPRGEPPLGVRQAAPRRADRGAAAREGAARSCERRAADARGPAPPRGARHRRAGPRRARAGRRRVRREEVIVVTITHDHAARRRSYELLAGGVRGFQHAVAHRHRAAAAADHFTRPG